MEDRRVQRDQRVDIVGIVVAYMALGWPALVVMLQWRTGTTRAALVELRTDMRQEAHAHR